ncbi:MAG: hypothetical protein ACT4OM_11510 [Actinomycetota bacterium]
MTALRKGLALALVQMLIMGMVAAKLAIDRARYPKVWVETAPFDPDLLLRGRFVRLALVVERPADLLPDQSFFFQGRLQVREGKLVAEQDLRGRHSFREGFCGTQAQEVNCFVLDRPVAYFIPEHVADPSIRLSGETLWAEVTVPPDGAPRPIRLGVSTNGGEIVPLDL